MQRFPSISLIEVGRLVEQVQRIANQISESMLPLIGMCLVAGLFALLAGIHATSQDREQEDQLLRIIGVEKKRIRLTNATEFVAIGLVSGFYGAMTAELIRWGLYANLLEIPFRLSLELLVGMPQISALTILMIGLWATRGRSDLSR